MADVEAEIRVSAAHHGRNPGSSADLWRVALRRRRFLVDRRYQLRASLVAVAVALVLLVLLNVSLFAGGSGRDTASASPATGSQFGLVLTGSLVFLVGVFLVGILETHRTAGAAYKIGRAMEKVRSGRLKIRLRLRRGDNLQDLAASFNAMIGALHERAWEDLETLESTAERIEHAAGDPDASAEAARALRRLAEARRRDLD